MKTSPSQQYINKPLLIGIACSALAHTLVISAYLLWDHHSIDEKKSAKEENFTIPLSVFAHKSSPILQEAISENTLLAPKQEASAPPKTKKQKINKIAQKELIAPSQNNSPLSTTNLTTVEKNTEESTIHTNVPHEAKAQHSAPFDSQHQSDPVVLNTQSTDQMELFTQIQKEITKRIIYPNTARKMKYEGITRFKFELLQDGSIKNVSVTKSSQYTSLDDAVLMAVKRASKHFPEVKKNYTIVMEIDFKMSQ